VRRTEKVGERVSTRLGQKILGYGGGPLRKRINWGGLDSWKGTMDQKIGPDGWGDKGDSCGRKSGQGKAQLIGIGWPKRWLGGEEVERG